MWEWTLDTFPAEDVAGRRALKAARKWLFLDGTEYRDWDWVYIHGPVGTGKTGLAFSMVEPWLRNYIEVGNGWPNVEFHNVRALLEEQRERFTRGESKEIRHLIDAELLVLDDLGAERPTEFALETIALIIETRHARGRRRRLDDRHFQLRAIRARAKARTRRPHRGQAHRQPHHRGDATDQARPRRLACEEGRSVSAVRLGLDLDRVNQRALNQRLMVFRYSRHARTATIVGLELILDVDLLSLLGQLAPEQESDLDAAGFSEYEHHQVDVLLGHAADHSPASGVA
jgi:hypothetical protein